MSSVAVVILNWNGKNLLERFLPSVIANSNGATIYVADNCSTDNSIEFLSLNYPDVKIIKNPCNYGFAGGYNHALQNLSEKYFVLLNSDVEVTPGWLPPMIELLEHNNEIACCQPKIKDQKNKDFFEYAGAAGGFIDKLGYPFCRGRIFYTTEKDEGQYENSSEIFWASGACLVVKAQIFKEVGGFDEDFFAHMEEIDLCWRIKNQGYKIYYTSKSTVFHVGGATLSVGSPRKTYLNFRNSLLMLLKNLTTKDILQVILIRLILDGVAGLKFLKDGLPLHTFAVIRAHFDCYFKSISIIKKRRTISQRPLKELDQVYKKILIWNYFLLKKKEFNKL